jgi:hypothetical protein
MKLCNWCQQILPLTAFALRSLASNKRQPYCKTCISNYCKAHYKANKPRHNRRRVVNWRRYRDRNRRLMQAFLCGKGCVDCGEQDPLVLEFDHVSGEKQGNISEMVSIGTAWSRIENEVAKCEIRCANCHRRKTARDFKWFKGDIGA